jgi:hypothetical protein
MAKPQCKHEDSRLTCRDCSKPICSACLVQCPVGFRCPECSGGGKKPSAGKAPNFLIVARSLTTCAVMGYVFGILEPFINIPFVSVFICLAAGMMAGKLAAPIVTDHRIGNATTVTLMFGLLIGMSFTQIAMMLGAVLVGVVQAFTSQPNLIVPMLSAFIGGLFNPMGFIMGFWRMTTWRWY